MKSIIVLAFIFSVYAKYEPIPNGGGNCTESIDCSITNGICDIPANSTIGQCVCFPQYTDTNCSYVRKDKALAGGLNIGLPFIGICGIGQLILGNKSEGLAQLLMGIACMFACIAACIIACICSLNKDGAGILGACLACIVSCLFLAAFIWSIVDGAFILQGKIADSNGVYPY